MKMKKMMLTLMVAVMATPMVHAQEQGEAMAKARSEKMEAQKVAYLTHRMDLTPEESKAFWPVYNEYQAAAKSLEESFETKMDLDNGQGEEKITNEQLEAQMSQKFEMQRKRVDLDEAYYRKFNEVLPPEKLLKFYEADVEFKRDLLRKLGANRGGMTEDQRMERHREMRQNQRPQQRSYPPKQK